MMAAAWFISPSNHAHGADISTNSSSSPSDPVLGLLLEKGMITEEEAARVQAQADALRTNEVSELPQYESKWKISDALKDVELFGDVRLRYEGREARDPKGGSINFEPLRYAVRVGLRGDLFDNFYYGVRMETASNPRSPWVTFGSSSSGTSPIRAFRQVHIGHRYWPGLFGLAFTALGGCHFGANAQSAFTTPMVWDSDLNPVGAAERFKYTVGMADFFATFGQFLYADTNPTQASPGYFNPLTTTSGSLPFMLAWQGGVDFHITKKLDFKIASTLYNYTAYNNGIPPSTTSGNDTTPGFSGTYVGQGGINGAGGPTVPAI